MYFVRKKTENLKPLTCMLQNGDKLIQSAIKKEK